MKIAVSGGTVRARRVDGPAGATPLLFLHGGPGGSSDGFAVFDELADERTIVMWDQLGSRRSSWEGQPDGLWTRDRFCEEVDAVRAAFDLDEVVLYGHSWGGWLSVDYLCRRPSGVVGAVLADTSACFTSFSASIDRRVSQLPPDLRAGVERRRSGVPVDDPEYHRAAIEFYRRFVVRNVPGEAVAESVLERQRSSEVFQWMQGADELHADGTLATWSRVADLPSVEVPTLVLVGRYDHLDEQCADELVAGLPNAEKVLFTESSHCPHLEQPDDVLAAVRRFLATMA